MLLDLKNWNRQRVILGTGQSGHLLSSHFDDLMKPHRDGQYLDVPFGNPETQKIFFWDSNHGAGRFEIN